MKHKLVIIVVALMVACSLQAQNVKKLAREVFENSGLNLITENLEQQFTMGLNANPAFAANPDSEPYKKKMLEVLNSNNIEKNLLSYLEEEVPLVELEAMAKFSKDPFVLEFAKLEQSLMQPGKQQEIAEYKTFLQDNPPSAERVQLVDQLIDAQNTIENMKQMSKTMIWSMMRGGNAMQPAAMQMSEEQLNNVVNQAFPPQIDGMLRQQLQTSNLFAYKDVPDDKLAKYVALWQSEDGAMTMRNMMESMNSAFEQLGEQLGHALASMKK
jgi:Trp operon repressor